MQSVVGDNERRSRILEIRSRIIRSSFGLFDHYFIVIDDYEYHLGGYRGKVMMPKGATINSNLCCLRTICDRCYAKIMYNIESGEYDKLLYKFFPFINCETFTCGISTQSLFVLTLPFVGTLLFYKKFLLTIILLLFALVILLWHSKYTLSRTTRSECEHVQKNQRH